jgi:hypothetical protein
VEYAPTFDRKYFLTRRMIRMKTLLTGAAIAALLVFGSTLPGFAEEPPAPQTPAAQAPATATPPTAQTEAPPSTMPRPAIVPKAAEAAPPAPAANAEPAPPHRRYAHYRHRRYGYYRTAYWEPFPIYWPHFYHNRVHWNRIPWLFRF